MKTFAQALDLKDDPELIRQYKEHHRNVWPEVVEGLRKIGITRMRIYLHGTRLFMYYDAPDDFNPDRDYQSYTASEQTQEWDRLMRQYQQQVPGATSNGWWTPMELVFDLEAE